MGLLESINGSLQDLWLTRAGGIRPVGIPQWVGTPVWTQSMSAFFAGGRECPNFCVRSFCDGEFRFWLHREWGVSGMAATVLGRTEQSSPEAAPRRAPLGAGLDGEGARQATMAAAAIPAISQPGPGLFGLGIIASILENAGRTVSRTGSWRWSIRYCAASACRHS